MALDSFTADRDSVFSGFVPQSGTGPNLDLPAGWSLLHPSPGIYRIVHNLNLAVPRSIHPVVTPFGNDVAPFAVRWHIRGMNANRFTVHMEDATNTLIDDAFFFVAVLPAT